MMELIYNGGRKVDLVAIEKVEREKYSKLHKEGYGAGKYEDRVGNFILPRVNKSDRILELGCGQGFLVKHFTANGYYARGVDITLDGVSGGKGLFKRAALWDLPFEDGEFDFSFSVDVMEHMPTELVGKVINEIYRVTTDKTFHIICPRPSMHREGLHLTVENARWWRTQFALKNPDHKQTIVIDSEEFSVFCLLEAWSGHDD